MQLESSKTLACIRDILTRIPDIPPVNWWLFQKYYKMTSPFNYNNGDQSVVIIELSFPFLSRYSLIIQAEFDWKRVQC